MEPSYTISSRIAEQRIALRLRAVTNHQSELAVRIRRLGLFLCSIPLLRRKQQHRIIRKHGPASKSQSQSGAPAAITIFFSGFSLSLFTHLYSRILAGKKTPRLMAELHSRNTLAETLRSLPDLRWNAALRKVKWSSPSTSKRHVGLVGRKLRPHGLHSGIEEYLSVVI